MAPISSSATRAQTLTTNPAKRQPAEPTVVLHQSTLRQPQWTYFHLSAYSTAPDAPDCDAISVRQNLSTALSKFLGLTGWAIPVDILKIHGAEVWLRVPRDNARAFHEGVSAWIGQGQLKYIVKAKDDWLPRMIISDGQDLF